MRFLRSLGLLLGSVPWLCAAQQPAADAAQQGPAGGATLTEEQRQTLIERLTALLDEEGRRIGDFTAGGAGFRIADTDFGTLNPADTARCTDFGS